MKSWMPRFMPMLIALPLFAAMPTWAQNEPQPPPLLERPEEPKKDLLKEADQALSNAAQKTSEFLGETRERRAESSFFILGNYSPLDLLLPGKYGATLGWIRNADISWEFEYLHGSVAVPFLIEDLGKMSDDRFSIIRRSYFGGNSFNVSYGLTYFDFSIHLGDKLLNKLSGNNYPSVDLVALQSIGFNLGIGNRWTFKHNITLGVDWVSWAQPVIVTKKDAEFLNYTNDPEDKDDVDTAVDVISYLPRLSFLKLQLGILF